MRSLVLLATVGLMSVGLGCNHTAGVCDCDPSGYGTPTAIIKPLPLPPAPPAADGKTTAEPVPAPKPDK